MTLIAPEGFVEGSAEPWIVDVLCALLRASDQRVVLETGGFVGATAARLAETLQEIGGGVLHVAEIDATRAATIDARLAALKVPGVTWRVWNDDVMRVIAAQPNESIGFVWVDDDHGQQHVFDELTALMPKMKPGGIICGHDVHGVCELHEVFSKFGGLSLDLPRLGPAGGIGIIQV